MASVVRNIASIVAHLPGVKAEVSVVGRRMESVAAARLAEHSRTGHAHIEGTQGVADFLVELVDDGEGDAVAIEYGHGEYVRKDGRRVGASEGLHVLGAALDAARL